MSGPLVSVCIPSYNHARWLPEAIESVLAQTYPNIELIVVDDGSADESLAIAERYATADPGRIRVLTHEGGANRGTSTTMNLALGNATGAYWSVLDSDDALHPHKLATELELLEADPALAFVYGQAEYVDREGRRILAGQLMGEDLNASGRPLARMLRDNLVPNLTALVPMRIIEEPPALRYDEDLVYGDWAFWLRLLGRGSARFLPLVLARSRHTGRNVSVGIGSELDNHHRTAVLERVEEDAGRIGGDLDSPEMRGLLELELVYRRHQVGEQTRAEHNLGAILESPRGPAAEPERLARWVVGTERPAAALPSTHAHLTAARWLAAGGIGAAPGEARPERNFAAWIVPLLPAPARAAVVGPLARAQLRLAAYAAAEQGSSLDAVRLSAAAMRIDPALFRDRGFRHGTVKSLLGRRLTTRLRSWQARVSVPSSRRALPVPMRGSCNARCGRLVSARRSSEVGSCRERSPLPISPGVLLPRD